MHSRWRILAPIIGIIGGFAYFCFLVLVAGILGGAGHGTNVLFNFAFPFKNASPFFWCAYGLAFSVRNYRWMSLLTLGFFIAPYVAWVILSLADSEGDSISGGSFAHPFLLIVVGALLFTQIWIGFYTVRSWNRFRESLRD